MLGPNGLHFLLYAILLALHTGEVHVRISLDLHDHLRWFTFLRGSHTLSHRVAWRNLEETPHGIPSVQATALHEHFVADLLSLCFDLLALGFELRLQLRLLIQQCLAPLNGLGILLGDLLQPQQKLGPHESLVGKLCLGGAARLLCRGTEPTSLLQRFEVVVGAVIDTPLCIQGLLQRSLHAGQRQGQLGPCRFKRLAGCLEDAGKAQTSAAVRRHRARSFRHLRFQGRQLLNDRLKHRFVLVHVAQHR
mmetsp:Transcript_145443/g.205936  ORF Transcript_145443/g.205936 Transcript_145443/m.205936 type:complete len:249 (-) Transcript_145443:13-759(-)